MNVYSNRHGVRSVRIAHQDLDGTGILCISIEGRHGAYEEIALFPDHGGSLEVYYDETTRPQELVPTSDNPFA